MLIELRDVEVHIEPLDVLTQALQDYDITTDHVISVCLDEESASTVLKSFDSDDIKDYCESAGIYRVIDFESIIHALSTLTQTEKAQLLWKLIQSKG